MKKILDELKKYKDNKFASFQAKLMPTVDKKSMIGVRTPDLKKLAKELAKEKDVESFLSELPHKYFDEMQLHAFIISELKDFESCIKYVEKFLPYVDNWATCDQLSPKVFAKHKEELLKYINKWVKSKKPYIIRFGIGMLMQHYLDKDFKKGYLDLVACINYGVDKIDINTNPDKYYVEMMRAWYFATALAKQYDATLPIIKNKKLIRWTHNKTIQKCIESYRITKDDKQTLKEMKL